MENLKKKLSKKVYKQLESFILNETDFSEKQKNKFVKLIEAVYSDGLQKTKTAHITEFPFLSDIGTIPSNSRDWG